MTTHTNRRDFIYATLEAFYADDERRRRSPEAQYGVHWTLPGWHDNWTIAYVHRTGEIYAVYHGPDHPVVTILGHCPPDHPVNSNIRENYYQTLDHILAGYADLCRSERTLHWVKHRLGQTVRSQTLAQIQLPTIEYGRSDNCINCGHSIAAESKLEWNLLALQPCPNCGDLMW